MFAFHGSDFVFDGLVGNYFGHQFDSPLHPDRSRHPPALHALVADSLLSRAALPYQISILVLEVLKFRWYYKDVVPLSRPVTA